MPSVYIISKNERGDECSMGGWVFQVDGSSRGMGVPGEYEFQGGMGVPGGYVFWGMVSRGMGVP